MTYSRGSEGVQVGVHFGLQCQVGLATPILDTLTQNHSSHTSNTPWNYSSSQIDPGVARSGVKMGWWSPCDAVALWFFQAVI